MAEPVEIDDNLYSRQRYVLGDEAMKKMNKSSVFLSGLGGLGVEIAKNIALAGVRLLTLNDAQNTTWLDLGTQFYLSATDIGKPRVDVTAPKIAELNPYVKVAVSKADLAHGDLSVLDTFKIVILTDAPLSLQVKVNAHCHQRGIQFISGEVRGVFSAAFVDFGNEFELVDPDGEDPKSSILANITQAKPPIVTVLENHRHGLEDGDFVELREVKGMTALNGKQYKVHVINPQSFSLLDADTGAPVDTSAMPSFAVGGGGLATQVKRARKLSFIPLADALLKPPFVTADWAKLEAPAQLLVAFQALHAYTEKTGSLPAPWNAAHAAEVLRLAEEINAKQKHVLTIDAGLVQKLAFTAQGSVVGLTAFLGGVIAQEALKGLTGKYTPIQQWLFVDAIEILPAVEGTPNPEPFAPCGDRSDALRIVLGKDVCEKLEGLRLFMIGAGAIGCEMLKNFAMLGVATSDGRITVTDNDLIEMSNLNRQFLFRKKDIRTPKSLTAAAAAKAMNPAMKIHAEQDKICSDTEAKYSDEFFEDLDVVVNALDNVQARLYVDSRCVTNQRPLLESGTLGTKGHVQVILPFLTESYGSRRDPPEADVPFCTLKSFPSAMEHCIEWARDFAFEAQFVNRAQTVNQVFDEPDLLAKLPTIELSKLRELRIITKMLRNRPSNFEDCVRWARRKFETYYSNSVRQLLHNFPLDAKVKDGAPFWAAPKRPPTPLKYDPNDPTHSQFVASAAALYAKMWKIAWPQQRDALIANAALVNEVIAKMNIPEWKPKAGKKIETDESVKKQDALKAEANETAEEEHKKLIKEISGFVAAGGKLSLEPADFEKDDDSNFHIDFITACSNLRARCYSIAEYERLKVKRIAGRIIPAIATTTAAISGLVSLELLKVVKQLPITAFKNAFLNLGISLFAFSEPAAVDKVKISDQVSFSMWDRWDVDEGDIALDEFIKYFQQKHQLKVAGVFQEVTMIYVPMFPMHAKRLPEKMTKLLKIPANAKYIDLILQFENSEGADVQGPVVRFHLPKKRKVLKKR